MICVYFYRNASFQWTTASCLLPDVITSLGKGGYVFGSFGMSVCGQHYSKSYERIGMKVYGGVLGSTIKN